MKNRVKKFIKDNGDVIIVAAPYVAVGVIYICLNKKADGMKIVRGAMSDDENSFAVYLQNGSKRVFYRPGT